MIIIEEFVLIINAGLGYTFFPYLSSLVTGSFTTAFKESCIHPERNLAAYAKLWLKQKQFVNMSICFRAPQKEMLSYSLFFGVPRHHSYFAIQFDAATSLCSVFAIGTVEKTCFHFV